MIPKRSIKAKEIVLDIRAGMTDSELMAKYKLSLRGLQSIFKKLEETKVMKPSELYGRQSLEADTVNLDQLRREVREYLSAPLTIYELDNPDARAVVTEISTIGVRVKGLRALVGETKRLRIEPQQFMHIDPFHFQAVCRWAKREGENRDYVAGFEITAIEEEDSSKLYQFVAKQRLRD